MDQSKARRMIVGGFLFIVVMSVSVFFAMNQYMGVRTSSDVRQVAQSYVTGIAAEALYHFATIKDIRFSQMFHLKDWVNSHADLNNAQSTADTISARAETQGLTTCALIAEDGSFETVYGVPFKSFGDPKFLMEHVKSGDMGVTGGRNERGQVIVWYIPASYPMRDGRRSVGMIGCRSMKVFMEEMHLDADGTFAFFHIIRRDSSFVTKPTNNLSGDTFFEDLQKNAIGLDKPMSSIVEEFGTAIENQKPISFVARYKDPGTGIEEGRSVLAVSLPESNWYLVSVMPFNAMDQMIVDMGAARGNLMMLAVAFLFLCVLVVFIFYYRMTQTQIHALEESTARTEALLEETRAANDEAMRAKRQAEDARLQAEETLVEAEAANDEAIRAREDAERAREDAEAANRAKSEFLSNMSHDIRTPMNAIVGMTSIARSHMDDPARVEDCLHKITLAGKQLLGLINDVLDMAKIESGKMVLSMEALSLRQTMEAMCDIIRPQIKANGQKFDIFISNILSEEVYCDGVRLNQVLLNFLSNAMKFTPKEGFVHIYLWQEESPKGRDFVRTHFSVKDSGIGMTKEFQKKLFTAFEREDNRRVHKTQGTGLGLTIAKHIVDAMGGTIQVESAPGEGTTFSVSIDFERVTESEKEMKLPPWKILVVDDNEDLCRTAELCLKELGTRPEYCTDGESAIKKVMEAHEAGEDFFAILIDYKMAGMNGIETTRKICETLGRDIPISLISSYDWSEIEEEARDAGITGFIAKPLFKSTLYHELKKYRSEDERSQDGTEDEEKKDKSEIRLDGMRILLAEDMEVNAEIATMILEDNGADVEHAEDGKIAAKMFAESSVGYYHAILMDLRMPHMNGFEAARAIRAMDREDAGEIPIIAMTADAFADDAEKCYAAGMNAHLAKPIDVDVLKALLLKYVKRES